MVQYLEKYSSTVQQLVYRGWHQVNRQEELLTEEGEGVTDGRAEGSPAIGDGGEAIITLMPDTERTRQSWFLAGFNSIYPLKKKKKKKKTVQGCLDSSSLFSHHRWPSSTRLHSERLLQPAGTILRSRPVLPKLTVPPHIKKILLPLTVSWISSVLQLLLPLVSLHPFSGPPIPSGLH